MPRVNPYKKQFQEYDRNVGLGPLYFAGFVAAVILAAVLWSYSAQQLNLHGSNSAITLPTQPEMPAQTR